MGDAYRRFRNTARFILGNLYDFDPDKDRVPYEDREELDRVALSWLAQLVERVKRAYREYEFHLVFHRLHQFCAVEMSAIYLDILKDRLYISQAESPARRSAQSTLYELLFDLTRLMAPILSFTAEEVWGYLPVPRREDSVHLAGFPESPPGFPDEKLLAKYEFLLKVRDEINRGLEEARKAKVLSTSQEAQVVLGTGDAELFHRLSQSAADLKILTQVADLPPPPAAREVLDFMRTTFGPERLVYASNWPVSERFAPLATVQGIVVDYFHSYGRAVQEQVFAGSAKTAYRWVRRKA